ncbi:major facilitator superfamily MFS_1 [Methylobacterium sp. 4-46]|uniref:MFS transporter n=1 Tax=unclassified Methylobacterium TaxID=2615210 RepID=UPI000152CD5C|nr:MULTISPECIES: MFS transporter [Methylobacterium]ACA15171.1 major facilitator superfamily MFS_1 [Methylobacterium sp. 4-46]WFT80905.1 MFS transporter [Methylobacterium nodulans]
MGKVGRLRWGILVLVALGTVVNYIDRNALGVLAPVLKEQLSFTTEQYSYVVAAFQVTYGLMQPLAGYLTDLIGLRTGYVVFALIWGTACALHGLATGWLSMAGFRALLAVGEGAAIPAAVKTSTLWFPPQERSIATGWFNTGSSVGAMIAPPLVIWLSLSLGWQAAFVITGLMSVGVALLWWLLYRDPDRHPALGAAERAHIGTRPALPRPSVRAVLTARPFWGIAAARFLTEPAWQTFNYWIPLYMVTARGMDIRQFALFAWMPFLAADLGCVASGYLSPFLARRFRISLRNSRVAGIGVGAVCMIGPGLIGLVASPFTVIALFSLGAFAHQMLSSLLYAVVTDRFAPQEVATATGFGGMAGYLGATLFSLLIGQAAARIGYEPLFACLSVFDLAALLVVWLLLGERGRAAAVPPALPLGAGPATMKAE